MNIQDMKTEDLIALVSDENKQFSVQDLVDIINNASAKVQNKSDNVTYLFYSGKVNGEFSGVVAENLARDNRLFATVKDTPAGQLLESKEFKSALRKAIRLDKEKAGEPVNKNIVQDEFRRLTTNTSFGEKLPYDKDKLSLWDSVSKKYTEEIQKIDGKNANIRIILGDDVVANNASITDFKNSVFHQTELPALLQKSGITVDGIPIDEIKKMPNPDSTIIANAMAISKLTNLSMGNTAEWANLTPEKTIELLDNADKNKELQSILKVVKDHWGDYVPENFGAYLADNKIAKNIPYAGLGILVLGMLSTNAQAAEAEAQGDTERAKEIWMDFIVGEASGEIASTLGAIVGTAAGIAILGLSAPVAIVAGLAVGIAAGIWGEEAGKDLYKLTKDLDGNGKADIFDRMGELYFGKEFNINDIPEKLRNNVSILNANLSAEDLANLAKTDIAYRYALVKLNPFVFKEGIDYEKLNENGELDLYSKQNPNGLTETYLEKRAEMLKVIISEYLKDEYSGRPAFLDITTEKTIRGISNQSAIIFGSDESDGEINPKMAGWSSQTGNGNDFLFGGGGNDTLKGELGNDYMEGGTDFDTYHIQHQDTIFDSDGRGRIIFDDLAVAPSVFKRSGGAWVQKDGDTVLYTAKQQGSDLVITPNQDKSNEVTIKDFFALAERSGNDTYRALSITLRPLKDDDKKDPPPPPPPPNTPPKNPPTLSDPLVLDLNHNGRIDTVHLSRGVNFDLDGNRFAEQTSWVGGQDGFVVLDINGNGRIDNGAELFGTDTLIQGTDNKASDGFMALAQYDNNKDGIINRHDDIFKYLKIWQDKNQDGVSQIDELKTLAEHGILDIGLTKHSDNQVDNNQVTHTYQGNFSQVVTVSTASEANPAETISTPVIKQGIAKTLLFQVNTSNTKWQVNEDEMQLPDDIKVLPNLIGYGTVKSLHDAVYDDKTGKLKDLIAQFNNAAFEDQSTIAEQILIHWTGQANTEKGEPIEGRVNLQQLGALKALWGKEYEWQNAGLNRFVVGVLEQAYQDTLNNLHSQLLSQTHHGVWLSLVDFKINQHEYKGVAERVYQADFGFLIDELLELYQNDSAYAKQMIKELNFTIKYLDINHSQLYNDWLQQFEGATTDYGLSELRGLLLQADIMHYSDRFYGAEQNDVLNATRGNAIVYGLVGDDVLRGSVGHDILVGGAGHDHLDGGMGSDTYVFSLGDGMDTIVDSNPESAKLDVIYLTNTIRPKEVRLKRDTYDLLVQYSKDDYITVKNFFEWGDVAEARIDQMQFADGTIWTLDDILVRVQQGTAENDAIYGYSADDVLDGAGGDDTIFGYAGNDTLNGNEGNDTLNGDEGDDILIGGQGNDYLNDNDGSNTYVFSLGDGRDSISGDKYSKDRNDIIVFTQGINSTQVLLLRRDSSLVIQYSPTDNVTIQNFFGFNVVNNPKIKQLQFADGAIWTLDDIKAKIAGGTLGDDYIQGYDREDDVINGQVGNDSLYGRSGNDTMSGGIGSDRLEGEFGDDILNGDEGDDHLYGGEDDDILNGDEGDDHLYGGEGNDILRGGRGNDRLEGYLGDDIYVFESNWGRDVLRERTGSNIVYFRNIDPDSLSFYRENQSLIIWQPDTDNRLEIEHYFAGYEIDAVTDVVELVRFDNGVEWRSPMILHKVLNGGAGHDVLYGFNGDDHMIGGLGNDVIKGNDGNDILYGNEGNDRLYGGLGDDILYGNEGDDVLSGGSGADILIGGEGRDTYYASKDVVIQDTGGVIYVDGSMSYFPWGDWGTSDTTTGFHGMSLLHPALLMQDADFLYREYSTNYYRLTNKNRRLGDFIYDDSKKTLTYKPNSWHYTQGPDDYTVERAELKHFIINNFDIKEVGAFDGWSVHINNATLDLVWSDADVYSGQFALRDFISQGGFESYYSDENDVIGDIGGAGFGWETIYALDGNDMIYLNKSNIELPSNSLSPTPIPKKNNSATVYAGAGDDTIISIGASPRMNIKGEEGNDRIEAHFGRVDGGAGNDTIIVSYGFVVGGAGNDSLTIFRGEVAGDEGDDMLMVADAPSTLHTPYFYNDSVTKLSGGLGNDTLKGNMGNNILIGDEGADTLIGGLGDDIYIVDEFDTYLEETKDLEGGYDTIHITSNFDLSTNNFEAVTLLGGGDFTVIGDNFDNKITGNTGDNHLDGKAGADTMSGGDGNDYYILDNEFDTITEQFGEGVDTLEQHTDRPFHVYDEFGNLVSSGSYHQLFDNVENLILKGTAKTAFGNYLDNTITLNEQNNFVNALSGNDTIIYQKGGGRDTILSADSLESKDSLVIEGYDLSEASFVRVANTASAHDMLQIRFKSNSEDVITLIDYFANEIDGYDNRIDQISFKKGETVTTLSQSEFEAKIIAQSQNTAPKVNKYPKPVTAHIGKELLVQFDKDTIKDADSYDSELSYRITLTTKNSQGQYEPIPSWLSFDPTTLTLKGIPPEGTKGNLQFILWGEDSFNYSAGAYVNLSVVNAPDTTTTPKPTNPVTPTTPQTGNLVKDTKGNDALKGDGKDTTFVYTGGKDTLTDTGGVDTLVFGNGITFNQVGSGLMQSGNDLVLRVNGSTANQITLKNFFADQSSIIETIKFETGGQIDYKQIYNLFGKTVPADTPAPVTDTTTPTTPTVSPQNNFVGTNKADKLTGTDGNDQLQGKAGADTLNGNAGNDILIGGTGNDTLMGGTGNDLYYFTKGFGRDTIVNTGGGYDNIYFEDISFNQVGSGLVKSGNNLILKVKGTTDELTLKDFFLGGDNASLNVHFKDGGSISNTQLLNAFKSTKTPTHTDSQGFNASLEIALGLMEEFRGLNGENGGVL